jgi:hypothetical protein
VTTSFEDVCDFLGLSVQEELLRRLELFIIFPTTDNFGGTGCNERTSFVYYM